MHVQLELDQPPTVFTNLDFIRGKVVLRLTTVTPITSVVVKLEGESQTRLINPGRPELNERPKPVDELHKILYKTDTVFSPRHTTASSANSVTLPPGNYEYPFEFKFPFNNVCHSSTKSTNFNLGGIKLEMAKIPLQHVRTTLPPTLTTFPGLAEIKYFLKVTVNRKEFYKENPRVTRIFNFVPIEPPRPPLSQVEAYARRRHQFLSITTPNSGKQPKDKMKRVFSGLGKTGSSSSSSSSSLFSSTSGTPSSTDLPEISVDARLPNPAIITCNERIPLRILVKRENRSSEPLYLQMLQVELVGKTAIRAQDARREESSSWLIASVSNVGAPLHFPPPPSEEGSSTPKDADANPEKRPAVEGFATVDPHLWQNPLPSTVAPSFETCNITRRYHLEIRIGIGYGAHAQRTMIVLPLHLDVQVYSGIHPPQELLSAMSNKPTKTAPSVPKASKPVTKKPLTPEARLNVSTAQASSSSGGAMAPQSPAVAPLPAGEEEPPPSYEDAIAQEISPIDGPRNYQPPPLPEGGSEFRVDEKGRRNS